MLVFTVDFPIMRSLVRTFQGQYFFLDAGNTIEIYSPSNQGILFRSVYTKKTDQEDMVFFEQYLREAVKVESVENISRGDIMIETLTRIEIAINDIRDILSRIIEKEAFEDMNKEAGMPEG